MITELNFYKSGLQVPSKYAKIGLIQNHFGSKELYFVGSGESHVCGIFEITADRTISEYKLKCWGDNTFGQIKIPKEVKDLVKSIDLSYLEYYKLYAFKNTNCFILNITKILELIDKFRPTDYIRCWGKINYSSDNQIYNIIEIGENETICLGIESSTKEFSCLGDNYIVQIPYELKYNNISASVGYDHACTQVRTDYSLELNCWGNNTNGKTNVPESLIYFTTSYVAATYYSCAAKPNAQVLCWGHLNYSPNLKYISIPLKISTYISAGVNHGCRIYDGELKCQGENDRNQLDIPINHQFDSVQVESGWDFNCSVNHVDKVDCWGLNTMGQLQVPLHLSSLSVISVHSSQYRSCALYKIDADTLKSTCWGGKNEFGENKIPIYSKYRGNLLEIAVGYYHTCINYSSLKIKCFGKNTNGQIDEPSEYNDAYLISAGEEHTCSNLKIKSYLKTNKNNWSLEYYRIQCWGSDSYGQSTVPDYVTQKVEHDYKDIKYENIFYQLKAGNNHTCVIHTKTEYNLLCWGLRYKQPEMKIYKYTTHLVAVGNDFDCMIYEGWQYYCWGDNQFGQCQKPEWGEEFKNVEESNELDN